MEARDEIPLLNLQRYLSRLGLLIIDELGDVPVSHRSGTALRRTRCSGVLFLEMS